MTHVGRSASPAVPNGDRDESIDEPTTTGVAHFKDVVAAYVGLTKPRVIELLLLTTVPVMFFAERGIPSLGLVAATVVGGALSAGSASTYNCVYDRDIDEQMRRTRRRALPRHLVTARSALVFATILACLAHPFNCCERRRLSRSMIPTYAVVIGTSRSALTLSIASASP